MLNQLEIQNKWQDIAYEEPCQLVQELSAFNLPAWVIEECANVEHFPEVRRFSGGFYLHMPVRTNWNEAQVNFCTIVVLPHLVLTLHSGQIPLLVNIYTQLSAMPLEELRNVNILLFLLEEIIDTNVSNLLLARHAVMLALEEVNMASGEEAQARVQILSKEVNRLTLQFEDQLYCLSSLQAQPFGLTDATKSVLPGLRELFDTQNHLVLGANRLGVRIREVQTHMQHLVQATTERRLRLLTLLSAVYMPLTFITGIYGMNFQHMPELTWEYGYVAVLIAIIFLACGLLLFFYWRKWLQ